MMLLACATPGVKRIDRFASRLTVRPPPVTTEEGNMLSGNDLDLEIALRKIHELSMTDGDLGYAYWNEVGQLLRRAAGMQAEIDFLAKELERCRAMLAQKLC